MARDVIIHQINDWSVLNSKDDVWNKIDLSTLEINFGIHKFQGRLWSSGYVGVGRLHERMDVICSRQERNILSLLLRNMAWNLGICLKR